MEFSGESELQEEDDDWSKDLTSSLERGANVAGFLKVVNAMKDLGWLQVSVTPSNMMVLHGKRSYELLRTNLGLVKDRNAFFLRNLH